MRQPPPRRWPARRLTTAPRRTPAAPAPDPIAQRLGQPLPAIPPELKAEAPGPDGVRHALVAHVRQLIADGAYDTPERWAAAEERLFEAVLDR